MVFLYDNGHLYSDKLGGQNEQFKGRVSHFKDELEQGDASIIIRNMTRADSGEYTCIVSSIQKKEKKKKTQIFNIKLVVEPKLIKVEEGSDVTLPCSLITKENLRLTRFIWQKVSQKTDDDQKVFLYDKGHLYSDERPGQSEKFKGRVSHFPDELEQGNASIIIRKTTRADSGEYRCIIPLIQKPQIFNINLVVGSTPESKEHHSLMMEERL
ncbi:uncharacterized protein LOC118495350 [Sander lucioperca]|uniref:uncharacterized protein LOC118495350 n=1 Tax=Sander lucioperca TaxID=283035 RepID=UPI001653D85F|nr:uncharacterized protein LOC118495350 [Sander lucioperca]